MWVGSKTVAADAEETEAAEAEMTDILEASTTAEAEEADIRLLEYAVLTGQLLAVGCVV